MSNIFYKKRRKIPAGPADWSGAGSNLRGGPPPLSGAGIQAFSKRTPGRKESQGVPPCIPWNKTARCSLAPSFGIAAQRDGSGFYRAPPTYPDLGTFFWGDFLWLDFLQSKIQQKIFSPNMRFQIWSGALLPERDRSRGHLPKRWSEPQRAVLKTGCRAEPCDSFPLLSYKESRAPAGQAGPRGAAPRGG